MRGHTLLVLPVLMRLFPLALALTVLAGCASDTNPEGSAPDGLAPSPSSASFDKALEDEPCTVLTADLVSATLDVPTENMEQMDMMGICSYSWDGGTAVLRSLDVFETADAAQQRFERAYRLMTPEERAQAEAAMADELERRRQEGEITDEQADQAGGFGGMFMDMAANTEYEPVSGVGEQAVYDGTIRTMDMPFVGEMRVASTELYTRTGNLIAAVSVDLFDPGDDLDATRAGPSDAVRAENKAKTTELARAVLASLR